MNTHLILLESETGFHVLNGFEILLLKLNFHLFSRKKKTSNINYQGFQVPFKKLCLPVKTSCLQAENITETPDYNTN